MALMVTGSKNPTSDLMSSFIVRFNREMQRFSDQIFRPGKYLDPDTIYFKCILPTRWTFSRLRPCRCNSCRAPTGLHCPAIHRRQGKRHPIQPLSVFGFHWLCSRLFAWERTRKVKCGDLRWMWRIMFVRKLPIGRLVEGLMHSIYPGWSSYMGRIFVQVPRHENYPRMEIATKTGTWLRALTEYIHPAEETYLDMIFHLNFIGWSNTEVFCGYDDYWWYEN
jgi:hypothetical protein